MKIYENKQAPNPRRARMFMVEKGVDFDDIEFVQLDILAGDNLQDDYRAKNPMRGIPTLELDDGTCLAESVAISRYFEELHPEPPLFGVDAKDKAIVEMWNRRMELNLLLPIAMAFRHLTGHFKDRETVVEPWGQASFENAGKMFKFMDRHLAEHEYVAGERFTIADITALCAVDFARVIKLRIGEDQTHLKRWYDSVSARPSAKA